MLDRLGPSALLYALIFTFGAVFLGPWCLLIAVPAWAIVGIDVARELWLILNGRLRLPCRRR